jgi:hypothetical protein
MSSAIAVSVPARMHSCSPRGGYIDDLFSR